MYIPPSIAPLQDNGCDPATLTDFSSKATANLRHLLYVIECDEHGDKFNSSAPEVGHVFLISAAYAAGAAPELAGSAMWSTLDIQTLSSRVISALVDAPQFGYVDNQPLRPEIEIESLDRRRDGPGETDQGRKGLLEDASDADELCHSENSVAERVRADRLENAVERWLPPGLCELQGRLRLKIGNEEMVPGFVLESVEEAGAHAVVAAHQLAWCVLQVPQQLGTRIKMTEIVKYRMLENGAALIFSDGMK